MKYLVAVLISTFASLIVVMPAFNEARSVDYFAISELITNFGVVFIILFSFACIVCYIHDTHE